MKIGSAAPIKRRLGSFASVISVAIAIGYLYYSGPGDVPVLLNQKKASALPAAAQLQQVLPVNPVQATGSFAPVKKQDIVAPFAGSVVEINYKSGDAVRAGAVVAIIQSHELIQRRADLRASINASRNDLQIKEEHLRSAESLAAQTRALYEQDLIARRDVEKAQGAADAARAQLDFVQAQLAQQEAMLAQLRSVEKFSRLSAPFSGIVSRVLAKPNAIVGEAAPIITITDVLREPQVPELVR